MEELQPAETIGEVVGSLDQLTAPLREFVAGIPALLMGASALIGGVLVCLALHWAIRRTLLRLTRGGDGFLRQVLLRTGGLTRLAFVLGGMIVTLPATSLPAEWIALIRHVISILLIVMVGWALMTTVSHTADRSLRRWIGADEENVEARKNRTQIRVFRRILNIVIFLVTAGACLLTFDSVKEYGAGLFASAGVAGIVAAVAARPVLANLIAGMQIAITQPMRIDDVVIVEGEWGWIEEITATYVVVRIWDWRRLVLPISYFIEKPFENWTRESGAIIGSVVLHLDYAAPFEALREKFDEVVRASSWWDGQVSVFQVIGASERTVEVRALMSARSSPRAWELRCEVREKILLWLREAHPEALPRDRGDVRLRPEGREAARDGPGPLAGRPAAAE
ncbi:mechanosensitive ion channel family protein [Albimonas sp. CAU 1670]|uniref:mechanosensitive ion channel family protein n=1 Tax=Albimonas sp. CAU 1670 TaxID=3032599 RepID=UPI0023D9AA7C|nr:mechanosensitive ion channel family protein [Albimonas sp. CAU 1670]MDF2233049.1 mechanosensitive ion channel family protein [Albimonas sp. CAU 1670]